MDCKLEVAVVPVSDVDRATSPLADALRRAEAAHGKYEEEIGRSDPDWPDWYARYMVNEPAGQGGA